MSADNNKDGDRTESIGNSGNDPDRPRIERLGHFKIEATLGSGGMGTIYRAYDESMKRPVALKVLHSSLEISERAQSRFVREAWIAGQLDHPNIIKVFSRGEENKVSYLALELAEGGSLSDLIEQTRESIPSGSDVTDTVDQDYIKDILAKFIGLTGALEHIHSKGFIHRDIKPQNVLLSGADNKFKLTDFGIAHAKDMTRMTQAGDFIGTVRYMSPELLAAHRAGIDKRTDIYSLGVTLYEALTLTLPFKADSEEKLIGEILAGHCIEARKANRRIPVDLETVLMKACNHDPDLRYQTAAEFADDLQRIIDGRPVLARRQSVVSKGVKYVRRNYKTVLGIAAAVLVVVSAILWSFYRTDWAHRPEADKLAQEEMGRKPDFTRIRIPTYPGNGVMSPDGEELAFASDGSIWTVPLHSKVDPNLAGEPVKLTDRIGAWNYGIVNTMAWSGDGKWIAFNASPNRSTNEIRVVSSAGGESRIVPVELHRGVRLKYFRVSLSPDGKTIAYASADKPLEDPETLVSTGELFIRVVPVEGGAVRQLTRTFSMEPAFSPDGKKIAFTAGPPVTRWADTTGGRFSDQHDDVYVVDADGGTPVQVSDLPGGGGYPIWSPDGRMIAFTANFEEANVICIVPISQDGKPEAEPKIVEPPIQNFKLSGWSTEGKIGLCTTEEPHFALYTVSASGGRAFQVTPEGQAEYPSWSPDGKRIFFLNTEREIAWVPADGGEIEIIPALFAERTPCAKLIPGYGGGNAVSPEGTSIVFSAVKEGIPGIHLWMIPVEGGKPVQLTSSPQPYEDRFPCWSPNGDSVAFLRFRYSRDGSSMQCNIFVVSVEGGEPRQITSDLDKVASSVIGWSPDGESVAFRSYQRLNQNRRKGTIKTIPLSGGTPTVVTEVKKTDPTTSLAWSPDGTKIVYNYDEKSIQVVSLEDSTITEVKTGLQDVHPYCVSWSPDGEKIAFSAYRKGEESFYLMERFLPLSQRDRFEPSAEPESKEMTVRMVWSGDEIYSTSLGLGCLSPDGRLVSFSKRLNGDLAILELANKEIRLFTSNFASWDAVETMPEKHRPAFVDSLLKFGRVAYGSAWSPDGSQLAYGWIAFGEEHGDLCLIGRDGTNKRTLTTGVNEKVKYIIPYDWSKDGEHILAGGVTEGDDIRLVSISAIDGSAKGIDTIEVSPHEFEGGYFSPDGCYVAYTSPNNDIFLLSVDGRSNEPLVEHPARDYVLGWSPDGRWVCFTSDRSGATDVWVMGVGNGKPQGEPQKVGRNIGEIIPLGITGEGSLYYGLESGIVDVYVATIDPEAGRLLTSPEKVTQRFEGTNDWPDWSPDGKYLLYRSDREASDNLGAKSPLCVRSMETGEERELYVQLRLFNSHYYSTDGRFVIVQGVDNDGQNGLFQIDVETGLATILVKCAAGTRIRWATWSPDGDKLFYKYMVTSEEPTRLMQYDLETRQEQELFRENSWPTCPALSPDGQWLAFQTLDQEKMNRSLNVMPADSGELREIVGLEGDEYISSIAWMPDGKSILYVKSTLDDPKQRELWQVSTEGGSPRNVGLTMDGMTFLSVHPDGRQIAFSAYKRQTEIWVMENFLPDELSQR